MVTVSQFLPLLSYNIIDLLPNNSLLVKCNLGVVYICRTSATEIDYYACGEQYEDILGKTYYPDQLADILGVIDEVVYKEHYYNRSEKTIYPPPPLESLFSSPSRQVKVNLTFAV